MNTNILISSAGIAELTLAYWLRKFNFNPTLIEKRHDLRDEGFMINFYGSGFDVGEKMSIIDRLQAKHYPISELKFVNTQAKIQAILPVEKCLVQQLYAIVAKPLLPVLKLPCDRYNGR